MIAKGTGYVKGGGARSRLSAHMKYIEHRKMDERESRDDRHIFDKDEDRVSRSDAVDDIMDHAHHNVSYHKMVLSPGRDEPVSDWREWTRAIMSDLEERQGRDLTWYAVYHENTDNPHVHVVLAGMGENRETGESEQVRLYADDYKFLRESGHEHSDYDWYQRLDVLREQYDREQDHELGVDSRSAPEHDRTADHADFDFGR
jgi:type IV secretory pathway VirD2 relaxase